VAGLSGADATNWRNVAAKFLDARGIESLDPMRARGSLISGPDSPDFNGYKDRGVFFTSRGIMARDFMARDFNDVKRCDALLVNLIDYAKPSPGAIMELAWAYAMQKPAVVALEAGNPHHGAHPMIFEAMPFRVSSLDEAIDTVAIILGR